MPQVAVDPVDSGGEWSGRSEGHTVTVELRAPSIEAGLARAVEGFADALGEVHPSATTEQHRVEVTGATPSALLLAVLEECLRTRRDGRLAVTLTDAALDGDELEATVHTVELGPHNGRATLGSVISWHEVTLEPGTDGDWSGRIVAR